MSIIIIIIFKFYLLYSTFRYPNQLLVHYNVKCENQEEVVYFNFIKMDLQDAECINYLNKAVYVINKLNSKLTH